MEGSPVLPYGILFIDASWKHLFKAAKHCIVGQPDRNHLIKQLEDFWTTKQNPNHVLPCLSVRSALDLFLSVMKFPQGSEVIMSAINIPDMSVVLHHHHLKIVPLDIDLESMSPKLHLLETLLSDKTKLLLLAHIYGKVFNVDPYIKLAHKHNVMVIEDLAEAFVGFDRIGHPETDLALFSFGVIKHSTAFGGAIAKIRHPYIFAQMNQVQNLYPTQSHAEYLKKVLKYSFLAFLMNVPYVPALNFAFMQYLGIDVKEYLVHSLRGFPNQLIQRLRHQPCNALLKTLVERMAEYDPAELALTNAKGDYVNERLGDKVTRIGMKADMRNYWLFPILVDNPADIIKALQALGIDAYRGATQLNLVEPDTDAQDQEQLVTKYPFEAEYIMNHVIYLPVHKLMAVQHLDKICSGLEYALRVCDSNMLRPVQRGLKVQAKL